MLNILKLFIKLSKLYQMAIFNYSQLLTIMIFIDQSFITSDMYV